MIIWQQETKTSAVLAFQAGELNLFVEVCTDSNWIQCWMHWRCTKHWLRPNRSCHLKKACHGISLNELSHSKLSRFTSIQNQDRWLSLNEFFPAYVEHIVRWFIHGQIHHHGCHSLPRNSPCFTREKRSSGPAVIFEPRTERSCQLQRQICELVLEKGENDDLLAWWASSPHGWSL